MAKFNPPESFSFDKPTEWTDWKRRFERYRTATELNKKSGEVQVCSLVYAMGSEAENIFKSFTFTDPGHQNNYNIVMEKFDEYFFPRRNVIHERAVFHQRVQRPGEPAETFIRALYDLSEHCEFGEGRDENIRDRIVVGIQDKEQSRKLQLMADLTLAQTIQSVRQSETVNMQISAQAAEAMAATASVQEVRGARKTNIKWQRNAERAGKTEHGRKCSRCGKTEHKDPERCPARNSACNKCGRNGHWQSQCKTKAVREVTEADEQSEYFLGSVNANASDEWTVQLLLGATPVKFKIDTGADASVMCEETFNMLIPERELKQTSVFLTSPGGQLDCKGQFQVNTTYKKNSYSFPVYVIRGKSVNNLLSRSTAAEMGLVKRIEEVHGAFGEHGTLKTEPVRIQLKDNATPYAVQTARRVPIPLTSKVREELRRMEEYGIIEEVTQPTDWCAPMVPVLKKNGKVRICVDLKKLNEQVKRERFILPTPEEITAELCGATVFSSLDAASGFFQIPLHSESSLLTTFITPFGRYCFRRLPFGITSAPEIFQRKMLETLQGLQGVSVYMDDIVVYGKDMEEHDLHLQKVLERVKSAGLKLNKEKCKLRQEQLNFLGQVVDATGVRPDPAKVRAIRELAAPENVHELKRILGMVNYLGKYVPNLSTVGQPLYELLRSKTAWTWGPAQHTAFEKLKELLMTSPVLVFYDVNRPTAVSADASSYGLGGVLLQLHGQNWKPVAYCSRRLTDAETRYAQIEKECLASVWACERFEKYLYGLESFELVTDHKPLVPLMNSKDLDNVPLRCQRLLMRLMRFKPVAAYAPGKTLVVADTLSRSPLSNAEDGRDTHSEVECYIAAVMDSVPATPQKMNNIRAATAADEKLQTVIRYIGSGWPEHACQVPSNIREYFSMRDELSEYGGMVVRGSRIVIPGTLRADILERIHDGHQGLSKCRDRANAAVWWPGISSQLKHKVLSCQSCCELRRAQQKEPLISTPLPDRPWQRIALDLCEHNKQNYLIISDYYSRYIEILHMKTTTSAHVSLKLKAICARYGIPDVVVSDNGPQFTSTEFQDLARELDFEHVTSSPHNAQGNGHAERAVQTAKRILKQNDPLIALMCYRSTPCSTTGASPAELLMGRKIRTTLPTLERNLQPSWPDGQRIRQKDEAEKKKQAFYYNRRHGARPLPPLQPGGNVLTKLDHQKSWTAPAVVTAESVTPRSYIIQTQQGARLRRNRRHLQEMPAPQPPGGKAPVLPVCTDNPDINRQQGDSSVSIHAGAENLSQTRSGRISKPVIRLDL
jgi:transposase InsO family protein